MQWGCHCARCGWSLEWEECEYCDDGLTDHDCGEDCCCCLDPELNVLCDICEGRGGWWVCLSSAEWCETHPLKGRETIRRSTPEWYEIKADDAEDRQ
jgi:hypothetical protein